MNEHTAYAVVSIGVIALTGFVFYVTGSVWTFTMLVLLPSLRDSNQ